MLVVWFFFWCELFSYSLKPSTVNWCFGLVVCTFGQLIWPSRRKVTWNTLKLSDHYRWSTNQCTDIWLGCIWLWPFQCPYKRMTLMIYNILNQDFDREVFCRKLGKRSSEAAKPGFAWNVRGHWAYKWTTPICDLDFMRFSWDFSCFFSHSPWDI